MSQKLEIILAPNPDLILNEGLTPDSDHFSPKPLTHLAIKRLELQDLSTHSIKVDLIKPTKEHDWEIIDQAFIAINEQLLDKIENLLSQAEGVMDGNQNPGPNSFDNLTSQIETLLHGSIVGPESMLHFPA